MASYEELSKFLDDYNPQQQQLGVNSFDGNTPQQLTPYEQMMRDNYGAPEMQAQQQENAEREGLFNNLINGFTSGAAGVLGGITGIPGQNAASNYFDEVVERNAPIRQHENAFSSLENFGNFLTDPSGAAYTVANQLGSMAALAPAAALVPEGLVGAGAAKAAHVLGKTVGRPAVNWLMTQGGRNALRMGVRGAATAVPESLSEWGSSSKELERQGDPNHMANSFEVFAKNMAMLPVSNGLEYMLLGKSIFHPKGEVGESLLKRIAMSPLRATPEATASAVQNGIEELYQQTASDTAEGKEVGSMLDPESWTASQKDAFEKGAFGSFILGMGSNTAGNLRGVNQEQSGETTSNNSAEPPRQFAVEPKIANEVTNSEFGDAVNVAMNDRSTNLVDRMRSLQGHITYGAQDGTNCARTIGLALVGTDYQDLINVDNFVEVAQSKGQLKDPANYVPKPGDLAVVNDGNHIVMVSDSGGTIQNGSSHNGVYEDEKSPQQMFGSVKYYISTSELSGNTTGGMALGQQVEQQPVAETQEQQLEKLHQEAVSNVDEVMGKKSPRQIEAEQKAAAEQEAAAQYMADNRSEYEPLVDYRTAFSQQELATLTPQQHVAMQNHLQEVVKNDPSITVTGKWAEMRKYYSELTGNQAVPYADSNLNAARPVARQSQPVAPANARNATTTPTTANTTNSTARTTAPTTTTQPTNGRRVFTEAETNEYKQRLAEINKDREDLVATFQQSGPFVAATATGPVKINSVNEIDYLMQQRKHQAADEIFAKREQPSAAPQNNSQPAQTPPTAPAGNQAKLQSAEEAFSKEEWDAMSEPQKKKIRGFFRNRQTEKNKSGGFKYAGFVNGSREEQIAAVRARRDRIMQDELNAEAAVSEPGGEEATVAGLEGTPIAPPAAAPQQGEAVSEPIPKRWRRGKPVEQKYVDMARRANEGDTKAAETFNKLPKGMQEQALKQLNENTGGNENVSENQESAQLQKPETGESGNQNVNAESEQSQQKQSESSEGAKNQNETEVKNKTASNIVTQFSERINKAESAEKAKAEANEALRLLKAAVTSKQATKEDAKTAADAINERVAEKINPNPKTIDGKIKDVMLQRLNSALGRGKVQSLPQNEFYDKLQQAYAESGSDEEAGSKVEPFRNGDATVYGFAYNGKIYLNDDVMNANTPAHEFTHVWVKVAQKANSKLWNEGVALLKNDAKELWNEVENDPLYSNIRGNDDAIASEVLARLAGDKNEEYINKLDPNKKYGLMKRIQDWVERVFNEIRSLFDQTSEKPLTYEEFSQMPLKSLWDVGANKQFRKQYDKTMGGSQVEAMARKKKEAVQENHRPGSVSTRNPTAVSATEDPLFDMLIADYESLKKNEKLFKKDINAMRTIEGLDVTATDPEEAAEQMIGRMVDNLLYVYRKVPKELRERAKKWYDGGRRMSEEWAKRYGISPQSAAGVIAVLSPQKNWYENVSLAERIFDCVYGKNNKTWDDAMTKVATIKKNSKDASGLVSQELKPELEKAKGKTLQQLIDNGDYTAAAIWVRAYDKAYNEKYYRVVTPEGGTGEYMLNAPNKEGIRAKTSIRWQGYGPIAKAISIAANPSHSNVSYQVGNAHKVRNFYNNLYDPLSPLFATIDTHAVGAALMHAVSGQSRVVKMNFQGAAGAGGSDVLGIAGTYPIYFEAYRRAAEKVGILPREMQSITWEAIRNIYPESIKDTEKETVEQQRIRAEWKKADDAIKAGADEKTALAKVRKKVYNIGTKGKPMPQFAWENTPADIAVGDTYDRSNVDIKKSNVKGTGVQIAFEVAPDPNNKKLTQRWDNNLSSEEKLKASIKVAENAVKKVLAEFDADGTFQIQVGGYKGKTNPSLMLTLSNPNAAVPVSKMLGYVLNQDSMMVISPQKISGTNPVGSVQVKLPEGWGQKEIAAFYDKLWEIKDNSGNNAIGGHSTSNGIMTIMNYSDLSDSELAEEILKIAPDYETMTSTMYSAFPERKDYGYAISDEGAVDGARVDRRANRIRSEAAEELERELSKAERRNVSKNGKRVQTRDGSSTQGTKTQGAERVLGGTQEGTGLRQTGNLVEQPKPPELQALYNTAEKNFPEIKDKAVSERVKDGIRQTVDFGKHEGDILESASENRLRQGVPELQGSTGPVLHSLGEQAGRNDGGMPLYSEKGFSLTRELINEGYVDLTGRKVSSVSDLAEIAQVLRHPGYEKLHYVYVKDGNVVYHETTSTFLPAVAKAQLKGEKLRQYEARMRENLRKYGADTFYLLHNHPDGDITPSSEDFNLTDFHKKYSAPSGVTFGGHIILDTTKCSVLTDGRTVNEHAIPESAQIHYADKADVPHITLGTKLGTSDALIEVSKKLADQSKTTVFFTDTSDKIRSVVQLPDEFTQMDERQMMRYLRWVAKQEYGTWAYIVTSDKDAYNAMLPLYRQGSGVYDILLTGEPATAKGQGEYRYSGRFNAYDFFGIESDASSAHKVLGEGVKTEQNKAGTREGASSMPELQASVAESTIPEVQRSVDELVDEVKKAFPSAKTVQREGQHLIFAMPNGSKIAVDIQNQVALSEEEAAKARKAHGKNNNQPIRVNGYTNTIDKNAAITLAQNGDKGTVFHEAFHTAWNLVMTPKEKTAMLQYFKDKTGGKDVQEAMADAYRDWQLARQRHQGTVFGKLFQKIQDFAKKMARILTGTENVHDVMRKVAEGEVWNRESQNAGARTDYLVTNNKITGDTKVPVIDISDMVRTDSTDAKVRAALAETLYGKEFKIIGSEGIGFTKKTEARRVNGKKKLVRPGDHLVRGDGNDMHHPRLVNKVRQKALTAVEDLLDNAVYIEKHPDSAHNTNSRWIDLYAAVKNGDRIYPIHLQAKEKDPGSGEFVVGKAMYYNLTKKEALPPTAKNKLMATETGKASSTISIADLLQNVKDGKGRPYVTDGKLNYDPALSSQPELQAKAGGRQYSISSAADTVLNKAERYVNRNVRQANTSTPEGRTSQIYANTGTKTKAQSIVETLKNYKDKFYREWVDKNHMLHYVDDFIEQTTGKKLSMGESIYYRAQMMRALANGAADTLIQGNEQSMNALRERIGKSVDPSDTARVARAKELKAKFKNVTMKDVLETISNKEMDQKHPDYLKQHGINSWREAFSNYIGARRLLELIRLVEAKELAKQYKLPKGISRADLEATVNNAPKEFNDAAQKFYQLQENLLILMEDGHLIPQAVHEKINSMYKEYCPLVIDYSDTAPLDAQLDGFISRDGAGIANVGSMLKHVLALGSEHGLKSPLESTYNSIQMLTNRAERNKVGVHFVRMVENNPDLAKSGILTKVEGSKAADSKNCVFTVMINGEKVAYKTTQDMYGPIVGYDEDSAGIVFNLAANTAGWLRAGATISPSFIIRNFIRDTIFAGISSRNNFTPIIDSWKGMYAYMHNKELRGEFDAMGITSFNFWGSTDNMVKSMDEIMGDTKINNPIDFIKWLFGHFREASEIVEASTRMGEYMKARKAGKSMEEAAFDARDVTLDFSRSGVSGQQYNRIVPFFNACIQGGDKMIRLIADKKTRAQTMRLLGQYILLPSVLLWAINHDEPWYEELDPQIKMNNWVFPGGIRIPKPQEAGVIFGSGAEAILDRLAQKDPAAMKNWAKSVKDVALPNMIPTIGLPMLEWWTNYSLFREKPLEGNRLKRLPAELRYNSNTAELSKAIGSATGLSPVKLDNAVRGYTGTMGMFAWQLFDYGFEEKRNLPSKNLKERAFIRDFAINDMNMNRTSEDFYNLVESAQQQHAGYGRKGKPTPAVRAINKAMTNVSKQNKDIQAITNNRHLTPDQKRRLIDRKREMIKTIQKATLKRYRDKFDV